MFKNATRPSSLRNRLIFGVSLMLVPMMTIAGGSFFFFEQAVFTFETTESKRLEELFPLAHLEDSLMKTTHLVEGMNSNNTLESQVRFRVLSQDIQQTLTLLLNSPSQLTEKRTLLLAIQQEWLQAKVQGEHFLNPSDSLHLAPFNSAITIQRRLQLTQHLEQTINRLRRLNDLLTNFQTSDNLQHAKALKQRVRAIISVIAVLAVSMAVASSLILAQSILKPLKILIEGVARFGNGDLSYRIRLTTHDEIEQLAHRINAMAQKLEQSQQALMELATVDGLTGVFNRREFNRRLTVELERSRREGHPVSLLMVDIDHFKKLNDTYGHQSGDDALRHISQLIKTEVRPGDQTARYGGEEFAVILPYADGHDVFTVAERLRELIAAQDITIQNGQVVRVTASLGCATYPTDAGSGETLMAEADSALYQAKDSGRNRVCQTRKVWA